MPPRVRRPLTARFVQNVHEPGMHCDGGGLYLCVSGPYGKSWIVRTVVFGKRRDFGLGSAKYVSLQEAREAAFHYVKTARRGENPELLRRQDVITFQDAALRAFEAQTAQWSSEKHTNLWWSSLERLVFPSIGKRPLDTIETRDIHAILEPIWRTKYDTAKRLRQRISLIYAWAKGAGLYRGANPTDGLTQALPSVRKEVKHRPALKWQDLPSFMQQLSGRVGVSARLMEFTILNCVRSGEARGACWSEIEGDVWTIPAERKKERKSHRIPLARQVQQMISTLDRSGQDYLFPSPNGARDGSSCQMSNMVFKALMKRMGIEGLTVHGFRSTFKDWCTDNSVADWEVSEVALAHKVGSSVERAYARSDLFERRRDLMQQWADFALGKVEKGGRKRKLPNRPKLKKKINSTKGC